MSQLSYFWDCSQRYPCTASCTVAKTVISGAPSQENAFYYGLPFSFLRLLSAGVAAVYHHIQFIQCWNWNPGPRAPTGKHSTD